MARSSRRARRGGGTSIRWRLAPPGRALRLCLLAGAFLLGGWFGWKRYEPDLRLYASLSAVREQRATLLEAARESGLDPCLLAGLMFVESSGRVDARSSAGALGLFQLMPATAGECAGELSLPVPSEEELLSDALLNARLGAHYLAGLLQRASAESAPDTRVERALVAYNTGPSRLARWLSESGSYAAWRATRSGSPLLAYARKVLRYRDYYREQELFEEDVGAGRSP